MLPVEFENKMKSFLGEEYAEFEKSYDREVARALRVNPLKGDAKKLGDVYDSRLVENKVPWSDNGYYYDNEVAPGKSPFHEAGAYYIQEPSAQLPAALLGPRPGDVVLDLCAAPGGKSTQIGGMLDGQGLLIANEINPARAKILSENVERMGIKNAIVTNEEPAKLAELFPLYFDKILVDAPCSGEGMFHKNDDAVTEWSLENVLMCAKRQEDILESADKMLKPGGVLVYSTCTFSVEENECNIREFLERHPDYTLERPEWVSEQIAGSEGRVDLPLTIRLWPHRIAGEGHFAARLIKGGEHSKERRYSTGGLQNAIDVKKIKEYREFVEETFKKDSDIYKQLDDRCYCLFGDNLYLLPVDAPSFKGLKVLRAGLCLGTLKKNRFEPSHALALASSISEVKNVYELDEDQAAHFTLGETFSAEGEKGWYVITVKGYTLGWGKLAGGIMKNHYPKGLRR